jgi:hypothetical protein
MFNQQTAEAAELFGLQRFPFGWALAGLVGTANIAATVLMLVASNTRCEALSRTEDRVRKGAGEIYR